jgi:glycosyltransferase involved in cell wall biosynthesis
MNKPIRFVTVVIPAYNEKESVGPLCEALQTVMAREKGYQWEILFVDDGSTDGTFGTYETAAARDRRFRGIRLRRNYGQTQAIMAGIEKARGDLIILMDADLQNDPADIPKLIAKINDGYDVVSGWRHPRRDPFLTRVFPSMVANSMISSVSGLRLKDYGCTLKAYRKEFIKNVRLYGEMHRFIPIYARLEGARVTEVAVNHRSRKFGRSKYGLNRIFKVFLDLFVIRFLDRYIGKPMHFFGSNGLVLAGLGAAISAFVLFQKFYFGVWAHKNPLLIVAVMFLIMGFQLILFGVMAEIQIRTYFEVKRTPSRSIDKTFHGS